MSTFIVETRHLSLIAANVEILEAAIEHRTLAVGENWVLDFTDFYSEFGDDPLRWVLENQKSHSESWRWFTYFAFHKSDKKIIGHGGYTGLPDSQGCVEIGYEILLIYRNRGLATEFAKGLISNAFAHPAVQRMVAHTLPEENSSTGVLRRCGFEKTGEIEDPEEGLIWRWELKR